MRFVVTSFLFALLITGCSSSETPLPGKVVYEDYHPTIRQLPPEPVYSRVTWGHLPSPVGIKTANDSVFLRRSMVFDLQKSSLEEAANAIAQSMGFEAVYSKLIKDRPVSINFEGTLEEALERLCAQTNTMAEVDRESRTVTVFDKDIVPTLPEGVALEE